MNEANLGAMFYRELKNRADSKCLQGLPDWDNLPKEIQELYQETAYWFSEYFDLSD